MKFNLHKEIRRHTTVSPGVEQHNTWTEHICRCSKAAAILQNVSLRISRSCPQARARHVANWQGKASQCALASMCVYVCVCVCVCVCVFVCVTETQQHYTSVRATHPSGVTAAAQEVFTSQYDGKTLTQFIYDIAPPGA